MSEPAQLIREINLGYTIIKVFNPIADNNYLMIIYHDVLGYDVAGNWTQRQIKTEKDKKTILFGNLAQIKKLLCQTYF
jgi:hypothetical protein